MSESLNPNVVVPVGAARAERTISIFAPSGKLLKSIVAAVRQSPVPDGVNAVSTAGNVVQSTLYDVLFRDIW